MRTSSKTYLTNKHWLYGCCTWLVTRYTNLRNIFMYVDLCTLFVNNIHYTAHHLCYTIALFEWQILIIRPLLSSPHNTTTRLIWFNYLNKSKWILKYFLRQIVNSLSIMKSLPVNRVDSYIIQWCCCCFDDSWNTRWSRMYAHRSFYFAPKLIFYSNSEVITSIQAIVSKQYCGYE